ncbi:hypothetical protein J1G42_15600 [Cellulomonas sp. zg-ZUI222]|uniref:hypothetical protein n=1 Tax=Cellulomonas wangleii TaxID=2816956 RepID=UPI001A948CD4|nr:hypothetical protein [Cellulomonas wangleii]MBO0922246.1 hypothetical protein [Cellulomonas wangleii]
MSDDVLRVADLRAALALALDAFEAEVGPEVPLDHDHYWHLPVDASFDLSREPQEHTVGQIIDDLHEAQGLVADGDAFPAWHALNHAIGLLRLLEHAARR